MVKKKIASILGNDPDPNHDPDPNDPGKYINKSIIDEINDANLKNVISDNVPVESDIIFDFKPTEFLKGILKVNDYSNLFSKENIKAIDDMLDTKLKKILIKMIQYTPMNYLLL